MEVKLSVGDRIRLKNGDLVLISNIINTGLIEVLVESKDGLSFQQITLEEIASIDQKADFIRIKVIPKPEFNNQNNQRVTEERL